MAEVQTSISDARDNLPSLSKSAQERMSRYVITHQGRPQSVLMGYDEYQGIKALAQLLHSAHAVQGIRKSLNEIGAGKRIDSESARQMLAERLWSPAIEQETAERNQADRGEVRSSAVSTESALGQASKIKRAKTRTAAGSTESVD